MPYTPGLSSELVKFSWEQISPTPLSDFETGQLSAACDELDALDLLASYTPGNPVGSNGNVSVRGSAEGAMIVTATPASDEARAAVGGLRSLGPIYVRLEG